MLGVVENFHLVKMKSHVASKIPLTTHLSSKYICSIFILKRRSQELELNHILLFLIIFQYFETKFGELLHICIKPKKITNATTSFPT